MSEVIYKPVRIPDPFERTRNDPHYLMSSSDVLRLMKTFYREEYTGFRNDLETRVVSTHSKQIITEDLLEPILIKAKEMGWGNVKLVGKQLEFIAHF